MSDSDPEVDWSLAYVPPEKLTDYLLSEEHPVGRSKARFLRARGYHEGNVGELSAALVALIQNAQEVEAHRTPFGTKFIAEGQIEAPDGETITLRTVWIVEPGRESPRFVTAYPGG